MRLLIAISLIVSFCLVSQANIINIPGNYSSIQAGINAGIDGDTVLVAPGTYLENVSIDDKDIVLASWFLTSGNPADIESTIIDGNESGSVISIYYGAGNYLSVIGFTITNGYVDHGGGIYCDNADPLIANNIIRSNIAYGFDGGAGGGIYCNYSDAVIKDNLIESNYSDGVLIGDGGGIYCSNNTPLITGNIIKSNSASMGGGFYFESCNPTLRHNLIVGNSGGFGGGGIYAEDVVLIIENCTFTENESDWWNGGAIYFEDQHLQATNSIFFYDEALQGSDEIEIIAGTADITYCDIQGGWSGEGNMSDGPYFRDPDNDDYHLMALDCGDQYDSPLIDMGNPDWLDTLLDCGWGLGTMISDIGAFGGGDSVVIGINDDNFELPDRLTFMQNYPNPFNASTSINFTLPRAQDIQLDIYDALGRKVTRLIDRYLEAGEYNVVWQSGDNASGVYFANLNSKTAQNGVRMVLLK